MFPAYHFCDMLKIEISYFVNLFSVQHQFDYWNDFCIENIKGNATIEVQVFCNHLSSGNSLKNVKTRLTKNRNQRISLYISFILLMMHKNSITNTY